MEMHVSEQQALHVSCPAKESLENDSGSVQHADEQVPLPAFSSGRIGGADTGRAETHPAPFVRAETHLPGEDHANELDRADSLRPMPLFPDQPENITSSQPTSETSSFSPSTPTQSNQSDVPADHAPAHQASSNPSKTASNAKLQPLPPLRLTESLGLEGCAGIMGGFFGILGVFGFLCFLWFGCELLFSSFLAICLDRATNIFAF
jgi:hypothetical protein